MHIANQCWYDIESLKSSHIYVLLTDKKKFWRMAYRNNVHGKSMLRWYREFKILTYICTSTPHGQNKSPENHALKRLLDLLSIFRKSSEIFEKRSKISRLKSLDYYIELLLFKLSTFHLVIARSTLEPRPTPTTQVTTQPPSIQGSPPPCSPRACQVSSWSTWSPCTHQCGTSGTQTRTRTKTVVEACGGSCPHTSEMRSCNRDKCQNSGTLTSNGCSCLPGYNGTCCEIGKLKTNSCTQNSPKKFTWWVLMSHESQKCPVMELDCLFLFHSLHTEGYKIQLQWNINPSLDLF